MTITQLQDRAHRLFGREADLTWLLQRTQRFGLTAITGPAQIGKSWVLMELARRLDRDTNPRCLVGFTRSPKGTDEPLLQVVSDLYQRWLADARAWEQLRMVCEQQKDGLLPAFARFVAKLSPKAGKLVPIFGELGGTAIKEALEGLVTASDDLRGRLIVPRLKHEQAQELVSSVHKITEQRISLVMDQWEETSNPEQQLNTFRDFLREPEQWPDCHILLGAKEGGKPAELLHDLETEYPGGVYVHTLGEMNLVDAIEQRRMISYLHAQPQLRALENIPDDSVLRLVAGNPCVIDRWTGEDARDTAKTFDGLKQLAQDANALRYRDLEKLLLKLEGDRRKLAARIALIPLVEAPDAWRALRPIILANINPDALDDLRDTDVLDREVEAPRFGHPTRRDAARSFLDTRRPEAIRAEGEYLILALARSVTAIDENVNHFCGVLRGLRDTAVQHNLGSLPLALCEAAPTLLGECPSSPVSLIEGVQQVLRVREAGFGFILSSGVLNTLVYAKREDDLAGRDALLDELRTLAHAYPDDAAVREYLAGGLAITLVDAKDEDDLARRDTLLDELRALARAYPDDAAVRELLAAGLRNTLVDAKDEGDLARRDALLDELRDLVRRHPEDAAAGVQLADGLHHLDNALVDAKDDLARRDALLDELRALARAHPDNADVSEELAGALVNALLYPKNKDDLARREALEDELRDLVRAHPDEAAERVWQAQLQARRHALVDEALALTHPDDVAVRELLRAYRNS